MSLPQICKNEGNVETIYVVLLINGNFCFIFQYLKSAILFKSRIMIWQPKQLRVQNFLSKTNLLEKGGFHILRFHCINVIFFKGHEFNGLYFASTFNFVVSFILHTLRN